MTKKVIKYPLSCFLIAVIWVICLLPVPETPLDNVAMIDKWTHFIMYGSLTLCIWTEYAYKHKSPHVCQRLMVGGFLCPVIMGGLVELAQAYLTTCRSGDWLDFLANSIGVCLGAALGLVVLHLRHDA